MRLGVALVLGLALTGCRTKLAPPNSGSAETLITLVHGANLGLFLPSYSPAVLGSCPSIYQLLARPRHGAYVDADDRRRIALDHLDKCLRRAEQFFRAMDTPAERPPGFEPRRRDGPAQQCARRRATA